MQRKRGKNVERNNANPKLDKQCCSAKQRIQIISQSRNQKLELAGTYELYPIQLFLSMIFINMFVMGKFNLIIDRIEYIKFRIIILNSLLLIFSLHTLVSQKLY